MILNYSLSGQGSTVVLLHGLLGSHQNLATVAKCLAEHYTVINLDLRNHGASGHDSEHNYQLMAEDVIATLDELKINQFVLFGHSMGGKTAMQIALSYPDRVQKLIVEDIAPVTYPERHKAIFDGLQAIDLTKLNNRQQADASLQQYVADIGIRRFLLTNLSRSEQGWQWKMNLPAIVEQYSNICDFTPPENSTFSNPVLFVKGGDSDYIQAQHQSIIKALFPNVTAKIIQGAGHWIHAEKSKIFNKVILDFIQK
ncbi:alpha/beta fold hydrolase [Catenovulum sp. 2E275]|uniref:alpha/beta fold hydrolase n=1 Tax=Catenovulum sp. 2E275 TaxID=2980497 RepID=UPI0021CEDB15|nr:alpha/beta fold hydrolase [Catenovulum sp. 2E275]MCU4676420.1 alpha/beta fold hydrolase [Catenovulum sp. 2E275]